jgi:2-C-methyl-D-erythritol 4-phosphate cytidylyltransferase
MTPSIIDRRDMREMAIISSQLHIMRSQLAINQAVMVILSAVRTSIHPEAIDQLISNLQTEADSIIAVIPVLDEEIEFLRRAKVEQIWTTMTG